MIYQILFDTSHRKWELCDLRVSAKVSATSFTKNKRKQRENIKMGRSVARRHPIY